MDFDPKKESTAFFGRAIVNEKELRDKAIKEREKNVNSQNKNQRDEEDDHFDKLMHDA